MKTQIYPLKDKNVELLALVARQSQQFEKWKENLTCYMNWFYV
jgi:hypothetical protein